MSELIAGAIAMASAVAALFFLKHWRQTHDKFFLLFALAFGIDSAARFALGVVDATQEYEPYVYLARLFTFGLIIAAVVEKNRAKKN